VVKTKIQRHGIGLLRAAGAPGKDPLDSIKFDQVSRVYTDQVPLNEWLHVTIIGDRGRTTVYFNGKKAGEQPKQMVCPLRWLGSKTGNSFVGQIRNLKVHDRKIEPVAAKQ